VNGASFNYLMPALSVVTFVGQASNSPPALTSVPDQAINAGITLMVTNPATDPDIQTEILTFNLLNGPTNATLTKLDATDAVFVWRPSVNQANTTNLITVVVTDSQVPPFSATNSFNVVVNPLVPVNFAPATATGGWLNLLINGPQGPDYTVQTSTDLINWSAQFMIESPTMPLQLQEPITTNLPNQFFRIQIGP
jgi:hypothetical protein